MTLKFVSLFVIMATPLGPSVPSLWLAVESKNTPANVASQLSVCLHKAFQQNTGFDHLNKLYDCLPRVSQDTDGRRLLYNITEPAAGRLNTSMKFLQNLSKRVAQQLSSTESAQRVNLTKCCQLNANGLLTQFNDRLRSSVDLTKGCSISESASQNTEEDSFKLNSELLKEFQENFNKSSFVVWQYYGSVNGEYLQYPGNTRYCDSSTPQFDPRFK